MQKYNADAEQTRNQVGTGQEARGSTGHALQCLTATQLALTADLHGQPALAVLCAWAWGFWQLPLGP